MCMVIVRMRRAVYMSTHAAGRVGSLRPRVGGFDGIFPRGLFGTPSRFLIPKPSLHLLEAKIRRSMNDTESSTGTGSNCRGSQTRDTLTLANHTILEVSDVKDEVP